MNRLDDKRYEQPGLFRFPLHINSTKDRTGSRDYVARTLNVRNEDGSPQYPLTFSPRSLATRILFSGEPGGYQKPRAWGVEYMVGAGLYGADNRYNANETGELRTVRASREVIVSGGSFNTPQILKLSGIGPRQELEQLGIPVVADLPAVVSRSTVSDY